MSHLKNIYLLLGSNLGNRIEHLNFAKSLISTTVAPIINTSAIYETEAWGMEDQSAFLNQVIYIKSDKHPEDLLALLQTIEHQVGRERTIHWGPRIIDIDMLLVDDMVYESARLTLPQKRLEDRRFALAPLAEIAPFALHAGLGKTAQQLLDECTDSLDVQVYVETADEEAA